MAAVFVVVESVEEYTAVLPVVVDSQPEPAVEYR